MSADDELQQVAAALDATPELVPYLAELLADLWDLGSSPPLIKSWLSDLQLPPGTSLLDLGCGKGAVSLTLARDLGFRVHGIDLFEPFVREARARAEEWGLTSLCRFEKGDLREVARSAEVCDVVVYASVGALGPLDTCMGALRRCVREGGFILVDDGFLVSSDRAEKGLENMTEHEEARRRLTAHGDEILREHILDPAEMRAIDDRYIRSISARAEAIAKARPADADLVRGYVERQRRAAAAWERSSVSATWLLRKAYSTVPRRMTTATTM
jgi:cyclopropane fatty-acyl-phospholipid synthase-like methyltransferase